MSSPNKSTQKYSNQEKIIFQGRTEQLDWKKIASINIDNLIHEGDTSQLLELIKPVTFCKADTEFDDGRIRIDPAFIKVFRISQLISEFLLASQEKAMERLTNLQVKYNETEKEKEKLSEEILHLKETLTSAKKELKKRKEMLANTQNEMLGENNADEYDQCPYCSKKFIGPGYLLAHIQRRHQGLPVNPLYPSLPTGSATVVCHHSHPQTPLASHHRHPHQQGPTNGIYDSNVSLPQSSHHVQTLMNHQLCPAVHTPSPTMLYTGNQLLPSNLSFSGSVTSLNNLPFNQNQGSTTVQNINATGLPKRESFTQTPIANEFYEFKSSSHLGLLTEETQQARNQQHDESCSSDKHSPDSLNLLATSLHRESPHVETSLVMRKPHPPVDGTHSTAADDGGGDAGFADTSTLRNCERVEATKVDVFRLPNQHEAHWRNLEEEKVGQSGTDVVTNAMISEPTQGSVRFPINSSQSHLREDGEVTKSPADVINHPQLVGDREQNGAKEFVELKRLLQASVQGELKSLISRLESQEQFWQDKLASLQQDHERQIQQLRQELQIQNGTRRNNNNRPALDDEEERVAIVNDKFQLEHEIGDGEKDGGILMDESSGNVPPPSGIILVGPKSAGGHLVPQRSHQEFEATTGGALRDTLQDNNNDKGGGESGGVPVAKPRKSKVAATQGKVTTHSYSDTEHMSSSAPSPISTKVHVHHPIIQHHQRSSSEHQQHKHSQRESSGGGTLAQLQSLSESDPEFLTIIQPEEFHEGEHDNSILPNSSDASATSATKSTVAANHKGSQQQYQHPLSSRTPPSTSGFLAGMNKSGGRGKEEEMAFAGAEVKSDEVSDYTLSDSVDVGDDEQNNDICSMSSKKNDRQHEEQHHQQRHHLEFADHPRGKSSLKQAPAKKKYIFDPEARKIVELSPDQYYESEDSYDNNGDLNSTSSTGDEHTEKKKSKSQSQLDLVRAKTIMELEQNMSDIGLNPESTAIGMEEMKRALKHFKSQQRAAAPADQNNDYERLEEERNAVKSLAKFEATKSSIDERLDAISTLSSKKSQRSSFVKILTAVKSSGKNFGKRVASAVKKKHKSEQGSDEDEKEKRANEKRKRKPSSAPATKTTFFSKARWTRKKKSEGTTSKKGGKATGGNKTGEGEAENSTDMSSSEESEEEIELPAFMQRSNRLHRRGSSSRSSERRASSGRSRHSSVRSSTRKKRSASRPQSAKPLKRLNSNATVMNRSSPSHQPKSSAAVTAAGKNSSESSPFSNVDEYDPDDDYEEQSSMHEKHGDNEKAEHFGNHPNNAMQRHRNNESKDFRKQSQQGFQKNPKGNTSDDDDFTDDELKRNEMTVKKTGRNKESQIEKGKRRVEDLGSSSFSSENHSEEDWDEDEVSFATSNEILAKAKSSGVISVGNHVKGNNEADLEDVDEHTSNKVMGMPTYSSSGKPNTVAIESKRWNNEMSDTRLKQIKQYVSKSKKEVTRDETSFSEEDSGEEFSARQEANGTKHTHHEESKQNYPRERKLAFMENASGSWKNAKHNVEDTNNTNAQLGWTSSPSTHVERHAQQRLLRLESPAPSHYNPSGQTSPKTQSGPTTFSELSTRKRFQFTCFDDESEWSNDNRLPNTSSKYGASSKQNRSNIQTPFATSTPIRQRTPSKESGHNETPSRRVMQNSFDEMNDLEDLLNTNTTLSDDEETEQQQQPKDTTLDKNRQSALALSSVKRKTPSSAMMQPTNHHHLSTLGMANLRNKAEAQNKLLHDKGRESPGSRNSWDSQK